MSGNGNGYQSGGMQQGYGGYSSGGYGGGYGQQSSGYGNGGYQPGMNSGGYQQSGQYGGMNGGFGQQQQGFQPWGNSMYSGNQWPQFGGMQYRDQRGFPGMGVRQGGGPQVGGASSASTSPAAGGSMTPQTDMNLGGAAGGNMYGTPGIVPPMPGVSQYSGQMDYGTFNPNLFGQAG